MASGESAIPDIDSALGALERVYRDVQTEVERLSARCNATGRCCDFIKAGYVLYATELELERVRRVVGTPGPWALTPSGECPFLTREKRCSIHPVRPLGCRTYFCDPGYRPHESGVYETFRNRIAEISDRYNIPWNYQPFHGLSALDAIRSPRKLIGTGSAVAVCHTTGAGLSPGPFP